LVTGFTALPGAGVQGSVDGRVVTVGSPRLFAELSFEVPSSLRRAAGTAAEAARIVVLVGWVGQARAALVVADRLGIPDADVFAEVRPEGKVRPSAACKPTGFRSAWSETASTTPPRRLRPTSPWRSALLGAALTPPSAPPT
jgi:cation transport ATPase